MPIGDTLFQRLRSCSGPELDALATILGETRSNDREVDIIHLSKSIRNAAGNSFVNVFRGDHDLEYQEILCDVAQHFASELGWPTTIPSDISETALEDYISIAASVADLPDRSTLPVDFLSAAEAQAYRFLGSEPATSRADHKIPTGVERGPATIAAATAVTYLGLNSVAIGLAPVAIAAATVWVAGPATRKTVPAVLLLIHSRRRLACEALIQAHILDHE